MKVGLCRRIYDELVGLFSCQHRSETWPQTNRRTGRTWVTCVECGREQAYEWRTMSRSAASSSRADRELAVLALAHGGKRMSLDSDLAVAALEMAGEDQRDETV